MPFPSPSLLPSPYLLPGDGSPGPFGNLVLNSTAPWNDSDGVWAVYNASLSAMFEPIYDIVADQGDVSQTQVAVLSAPLSTAAPVTALPVVAVGPAVALGTQIVLSFAQSSQTFTLAVVARTGDTTLYVESTTPNFAYPVGTDVQLAYIPGWSTLLDPNSCPDQFLPFLAQFNGTDVPVGLDAATARAKILGESAQQRGTLAAVTSAAQRNLSGTQSVFIEERVDALGNPNAYWFVLIVRRSELISATALTDAVNAVKPGGVQWTLVRSDGYTWAQATHTWSADTFSWSSAANTQP